MAVSTATPMRVREQSTKPEQLIRSSWEKAFQDLSKRKVLCLVTPSDLSDHIYTIYIVIYTFTNVYIYIYT